jgi:hypothetical protein
MPWTKNGEEYRFRLPYKKDHIFFYAPIRIKKEVKNYRLIIKDKRFVILKTLKKAKELGMVQWRKIIDREIEEVKDELLELENIQKLIDKQLNKDFDTSGIFNSEDEISEGWESKSV